MQKANKESKREERKRQKQERQEQRRIQVVKKAEKKAQRQQKQQRRTDAAMLIDKCLVPLVARLETLFPNKNYTLFLDGAPYHQAKKVHDWFNANNIRYVVGGKNGKWPGNSPDINPQENVWAITKSRSYKQSNKNLEQVDKEFRTAHDNITAEVCKKMLLGMKGRLETVIEREGRYIGK